MKLELITGFIANSLEADGEDIYEMSKHQQSEIILKILDKLEPTVGYLNIIKSLIEDHYDDVDFSDPCDQCGDTVSTYKLEI